MKKIMLNVVTVAIVVGVFGAAYYYWQQFQAKPEVVVQAPAPKLPSTPPKPEIRQVVESAPVPPELPQLDASDHYVFNALTDLIANKSLMKIFISEQIIHNIVATVDNLPSQRAPMSVMPIEPAHGKFLTAGKDADLIVSPKNVMRYKLYVSFAEAIDAEKLVELYVQLYPLFQQSYAELGYPKKYFNDRLIFALDDLLAAPDVQEPVRLVQPKYYYQFANPDLEKRSIGQRILMRIGSHNEAIVKAKLNEIKQALRLHMHEEKINAVE